MYKIFIVDDEPSARLGLIDFFPWDKYNCRIVGEAEDGVKALKKINELKPDVVITDVKMPNMDGMELASHIIKDFPDTKIIFISGYNDIAYLKEAFKLSAVDYVFKPINLKEMERIIQNMTADLNAHKKQMVQMQKMESQLIQSMPVLKERFFMMLIHDTDLSDASIRKRKDFLDIKIPEDSCFNIVIVSVDSAAEFFETKSERDSQLLSFAILNVLQELLEIRFEGYSFEEARGEYVCIVCLDYEQAEDITEFAKEIRDKLLEYLGLSITVGIGSLVTDIKDLHCSYENAFKAVGRRLFLGQNHVIAMEYQDESDADCYKFDFDRTERLANYLKSGEYQTAELEIDSFFDEISNHHEMSKHYIQSLCMNFLLLSNQLLYGDESEAEEYTEDQLKQTDTFYKLETISEMREFILERFKKVCSYFEQRQNSKQKNLIRIIQDIINRRYSENLTIKKIADEVFFNATYLSFIFKRETGMTINDYITMVRMEEAKRLLSDTTMKSYEICLAVGYQDAGYFSRLFSKYTGCTPSQYRERL